MTLDCPGMAKPKAFGAYLEFLRDIFALPSYLAARKEFPESLLGTSISRNDAGSPALFVLRGVCAMASPSVRKLVIQGMGRKRRETNDTVFRDLGVSCFH